MEKVRVVCVCFCAANTDRLLQAMLLRAMLATNVCVRVQFQQEHETVEVHAEPVETSFLANLHTRR